MAAEESSQGAALGPEFSQTGGDPPAESDFPDLRDVLGEFMVALCVIDVVSRALMELHAEAGEGIGSCALALQHGYELLDAVYNRFDKGLLGYTSPDEDDADPNYDDSGDDVGLAPDGRRAIQAALRAVWDILGTVPRARDALSELIDKLESEPGELTPKNSSAESAIAN